MEQYNFKADFSGSVFRLMGRLLLIVILVQVLISLISYLVTSLVAPELTAVIEEMQNVMQNGGNPEDWVNEMRNIAFGSGALSYSSISIMFIISLLLSLMSYNVIFNGIKNEVHSGDNSLGSAINGIFDSRLVKYVALYFLMILAFSAIFILISFTGSSILIILSMIILFPIFVWFSISYAAVGIDNVSIGSALQIATSNLTISRWAKVLGIGFVTFIALIIIGFILGLISMLIIQIPAVGPILGQIINALLGAVMIAFMLSGFSGLYFKYTKSHQAEEEFIVTD